MAGTPDDLDQLWSAPARRSAPRPSAHPETEALTRARHGDLRAAVGLLHRHLDATWHVALVSTLEPSGAAEATVAGWSVVASGARNDTRSFRLRAVANVQRAAAARAERPPRNGGRPASPFGTDADPSGLVAAFERLERDQRSAWWLLHVESLSAGATVELLRRRGVAAGTAVRLADEALRASVLVERAAVAERDCRRATTRFDAYLEGRLADTDVALLHRHLDTCAACTSVLDGLEDPATVLTARIADPPAAVRAALCDVLLSRGGPR